jgi:NDP-sugar pyrophosphorylase family protein
MKAMVLAAGLGTRLRPLTNDRPKALVEVGGRTLLEITLRRLSSFGVREVIINVHHFAKMVIESLEKHDSFGLRIEISREDALLDTGGGLRKAAWFFESDAEPFVLHNVDVISTIDLRRMLQFHQENHALATIAVQDRKTARPLIFDSQGQFRGRAEKSTPSGMTALAFSGVHVISPQFLGVMSEEGAFSIIDSYVRLASQGEKIMGFRADEYYWRDLGKPENVIQAAKDAETGVVAL